VTPANALIAASSSSSSSSDVFFCYRRLTWQDHPLQSIFDRIHSFNNLIVMVQFCPTFYMSSIHRRKRKRKRRRRGKRRRRKRIQRRRRIFHISTKRYANECRQKLTGTRLFAQVKLIPLVHLSQRRLFTLLSDINDRVNQLTDNPTDRAYRPTVYRITRHFFLTAHTYCAYSHREVRLSRPR